MNLAAWCALWNRFANYSCGLVPITILIGTALSAENGGPFSMPRNLSQSALQLGRVLAIPTALSESTRKFAARSISEPEASLTTTAIPVTAPPPVQFHEPVFQPLISKGLKIICPTQSVRECHL